MSFRSQTSRGGFSSSMSPRVSVETAATGEDALTRLWDNDYDAVLIQDSLHDLAGAEFLRTLRSTSHTATLPAMLVSEIGDTTDHDDVKARLTELVQRSPHAPVRERRRSRRQSTK